MQTFDFESTSTDRLNESYQRRVALVGNTTIARIAGFAGAATRPHSHECEEIVLVLSGAWRFTLPEGEVVLRAGQGLRIPGGVEHSSEMLEDTVAIDLCAPARLDWLSGDDRYLHVDPDDFLWAV